MPPKFLKYPTLPIRVKKKKKINDLLTEMIATGFQGRRLGECFLVWLQMLREKKITIWLGIS